MEGSYMQLLDFDNPFTLEVDDVLSLAECQQLIERIDELGPQIATVNTLGRASVAEEMRNNERVIFDDPDLAARQFEAVKDQLPAWHLDRKIKGANERFRCYRYQPGMRFKAHADGPFRRNEREMSFYTMLVYLNDGFEGGATVFLEGEEQAIKPKPGCTLLFQHPLLHEGAEVTSGVKYVARTDILYST
jgi:hypothetical protein